MLRFPYILITQVYLLPTLEILIDNIIATTETIKTWIEPLRNGGYFPRSSERW